MKNFFAAAIAALLILLLFLTVLAAPFYDVCDGDYYAAAAERIAARGILEGYGDGYYYGDHSITRAQIAALACKMLGKADEADALWGSTSFLDIDDSEWYTGFVNYTSANGIISGDGNGKFRPDDYVKYEEAVKVIVCVLGLSHEVRMSSSDWTKGYFEVAERYGLTDGLIGKKGECMLRSDIAVICDRAMTILDGAAEESGTCTSSETSAVTSETEEPPQTTETTLATTTRENALPGFGFGD